jgi:hypothetical protein
MPRGGLRRVAAPLPDLARGFLLPSSDGRHDVGDAARGPRRNTVPRILMCFFENRRAVLSAIAEAKEEVFAKTAISAGGRSSLP